MTLFTYYRRYKRWPVERFLRYVGLRYSPYFYGKLRPILRLRLPEANPGSSVFLELYKPATPRVWMSLWSIDQTRDFELIRKCDEPLLVLAYPEAFS